MTQWVFDVGNSRVKAAPVHADGSLGEGLAIPHDEVDVATALDAALPQTITRTASAALASVASAARTAAVVDALTRRFGTVRWFANKAICRSEMCGG